MKIFLSLFTAFIVCASTIYSAGSDSNLTIAQQCDRFAETYRQLCLVDNKECDVDFPDVTNYSENNATLYTITTLTPLITKVINHYQRTNNEKIMKLIRAHSTEHLLPTQKDPMYKKEVIFKRSNSSSKLIRQASKKLVEERHRILSLSLARTYLNLQTALNPDDNLIGDIEKLLTMLGDGTA